VDGSPLEAIRTEFRSLPLRELLDKPPRALLGVTPTAEAALATLEIATVFDLATSAVFDGATRLLAAGSDLHSVLYQHGTSTADLVRESVVAGVKIGEIQFLGLDALQAIPKSKAADIQAALDVTTVRDLALYPPFRVALDLLNVLYFPESISGFDPERPADLLPKTGEYPTERVQYTTLLMDAIEPDDGQALVDVSGAAFKPLDLATLAKEDTGFKKIAFGALLTFNQSWYAQGVTLGQLLHSTSLAAGESTRIAVIDWSRKSRAGETEIIDETDDLTSDTSHNRSISEVTQAVANEAQSGFSEANSNSRSTQQGTSSAAELSAPLGGLFGGVSGSVGHTSSEATTNTHADSYSTSFGHRDVGTSMLQNVNDRTHQHAHSARSRRASVVKEVSQSEHEDVSTRVLTNYNHMHALTVQYYEVVQVYRVEVAIAKADKVVFIPVGLVDFTDDAMVRRFQSVLARAALTSEMSEAMRNLDVLELAPIKETHFTLLGDRLSIFVKQALATRTSMTAGGALAARMMPSTLIDGGATAAPMESASTPPVVMRPRAATVLPVMQELNSRLWTVDQAARLSGLLNRPVLRADSASVFLPTDVTVEGGVVAAGDTPIRIVFHTQEGGTTDDVSGEKPLAMSEVTRIALVGSSAERDVSADVTLTVNRNGVRFPIELPSVMIAKAAAKETPVVDVKAGGVNANLKQHLNNNRLYYSQAVFRSLDSAQMALLLSGYGIEVAGEVVPVAQVVEPQPVRYVGNYLAFKMNSDSENDKQWGGWLRDHGIRLGASQEDVVPLPSGGTFAEAILGRSNCAEKLDITRFWNWQDSPLPLQPTEIAAISTESRATSEDVKPGQLSNPIINIATPTSLPDPTGTAAILAAIQNGSMFRDMSGLQGTIGLAQAALQATSAGAATAGQQAGTNMNSLLQANTERQRIAADMITSLAKTAASVYTGGLAGGGGGGVGSGGGSHSQDGAKINYFDKSQGAPPSGGSGAAGGGGVSTVGGGQSGGGGPTTGAGGSGGGGSVGGSDSGEDGFSRNPAALAATWGDSQSPSGLIDKIVDRVGGVFGAEDAQPTALVNRNAWPKLDPNTVIIRIEELRDHPNLFNQGAVGLCTAAAFYHHVLQRKPAEFASFANALYGAGIGFLGKCKVAPGSDLRTADYAALSMKWPGMPPQADWMLMSALRDSENWFFDYEGSPDESVAISTSAKELSDWYDQTGFYTKVENVDQMTLPKIKAVKKTANNQVALWIRIALLQPGSATHMITVESPITLDEPNDKATFDYWTWGQPVKTLTTTVTALKANVLGAITASF
jgi:hypothetical protein